MYHEKFQPPPSVLALILLCLDYHPKVEFPLQNKRPSALPKHKPVATLPLLYNKMQFLILLAAFVATVAAGVHNIAQEYVIFVNSYNRGLHSIAM
jgi:hypothetical protein